MLVQTVPVLSMTSPLGDGALRPASATLEEALSEPFVCVVDVVSIRKTIAPDELLHQPVCLSIGAPQVVRHVHGMVRRLAATGPAGRALHGYRLEVVPALWFLGLTQDCRIWQNMSTKAILQAIFSEHELAADIEVEDTRPRPFTVQYNETDLAFVSRLMREDGWFYWFDHEGSKHMLVVADTTAKFDSIGGPYTPAPGSSADVLSAWHPANAVAPGKVMMGDYDPEQPHNAVSGETETVLTTAGCDTIDPFYWPAGVKAPDAVTATTKRWMQANEAASALSHGAGFSPRFQPGAKLTIGDGGAREPQSWMLVRVNHTITDNSWRNGVEPSSCTNNFSAFPARLPWRPLRTVTRPRIEGVFSAVVIGPNEIHTDELGRVKVRFHWDRRHDASAEAGIWVRVMQPWAGKATGWSFTPRVGSEVAVAFMDADPDQPVIVGALYNAEYKPPFKLPDHKSRSGIRTRSLNGGGAEEYSELSFDDASGAEQVLIHAQRDLSVEVENDAIHAIKHDRSVTVEQGNDTLTVKQGSRTVDVTTGNHTIKSNQGDIAIKTALGSISVEAMQTITLKVGQSSITLDQSGVTIKGTMVKVEAQVLAQTKAPIVKIDADGMLDASGGVIMLN